jgi:hypothetical protein
MTRIPDFHEEMDRLQSHIPSLVGHNLNRLRGKRALWVRVLTGVAWCLVFPPTPDGRYLDAASWTRAARS